MNDCFLPGGTTVTTQSYSLHRDSNLFPSPEIFMPDRWTTKDQPYRISDNGRVAYSPFGAGSRTCLGIHLAYLELRLAAVEFFRKISHEAVLAPSATAACMEQENFFLIAPAGHKCEIALKQ
ncbi:hypothetical protein LTR86_005031 [Recurvomyces mirabilis]|nr:hypothetical protein LTR86_005031 [Recurvomyces mirabilis]